MAITLSANETLQQVGVMGLRAPDGSIEECVPLYRIINQDTVNKKTGLCEGEAKMIEEFASSMIPHFREYMQFVKENRYKPSGTPGSY